LISVRVKYFGNASDLSCLSGHRACAAAGNKYVYFATNLSSSRYCI
jgi:hypothetical protein